MGTFSDGKGREKLLQAKLLPMLLNRDLKAEVRFLGGVRKVTFPRVTFLCFFRHFFCGELAVAAHLFNDNGGVLR